MIIICFIRNTNLLSDEMIASYVAAQQIQISRDFAPAWGTDAMCVFVPPGGDIPPGAWQLWFCDHTDQDGALGYHDDNGNPIAYVFTADDLADGLAWSVTASHETLEMLGDPKIDQVVDAGGFEYAREVCDTCEDDSLAYLINGHLMSAFALLSWFDPHGVAPFTYPSVASITAPFQLAAGGYIGVRSLPDGTWSQRFAEQMILFPRQIKRGHSRTVRRFNAA